MQLTSSTRKAHAMTIRPTDASLVDPAEQVVTLPVCEGPR